MKVPSCSTAFAPGRLGDRAGEHRRRHDAGRDRILEVVAHVGDPVGPGDDLSLRRGRSRAGPGVVADAVERLLAQVERIQDDVGPPDGVVVPLGHVGAQRVLAGVPTGPVPAVVPEGDGFGERDVEAEGGRHAPGDLRHLQGVRETGALVVVREDEHLGLAGQAAEGGSVEDAIPVPLEARPPRVRLLLLPAVARTTCPCGARSHGGVLGRLAGRAVHAVGRPGAGARALVGQHDALRGVAAHGGTPRPGPIGRHAHEGTPRV